MKTTIYYLTFASLLLLYGCNKCDRFFLFGCPDDPLQEELDAYIYADYENPSSGTASLTIDQERTYDFINMEQNPTISEMNGRIFFNYPAVTFKMNNNVFEIDSILTERYSIDKWIRDDENFLKHTPSKSLDIVFVLDVSSSLQENIELVKEYSNSVIKSILQANIDVNISVVKFSRGSVALPLTSSYNTIESFILDPAVYTSTDIGDYELEGRPETGLYEAIDAAIDILEASNARGKGILTFTDGVSNYQVDPIHQLPAEIINRMTNLNVSNYTIGFRGNQGGVDETALESISVNGEFSVANNVSELNKVFIHFSNNIAAVYDLIYETNNALLSNKITYRFGFKLNKIN